MQFAELVLTSRTEGLRRGKQDLVDLRNEGARTEQSLTGSTSKMSKGFDGVMSSAKGMAMQLAAAAGAVVTVQKAFGAAEQYTTMQNRLVALGASHEAAASQLQQLADISMGTRAPLEATAELYSRLSLTANSLGASQEELMQFTEAVGLALAASGTSAGQASGALTQLSQAMAGGVVRAEEFNSMIEGAPGLLMAVANGIDGVNGDLGALRQLMLDGELTSEQFFNALLSQTDALQTAFDTTTPTISQALTVLNDQFTLFIGSADQATGVTSAIADAILILAQNMDVAVPVFGAVAVGVAAISAPILAAGVAIGALAVAVITHWDEIEKAFGDGVDYVMGLGPRLVQALKDAGAAALQAAHQIGADIIAGIRTGIEQKWTDLKSYVSGLGTGMLDSMKDALGIRSPSREFMEVGRYSVEGLEIGLDENAHLAISRAELLGQEIGQGVKDGLDPVLRTVFDGLARGDLGSIGSGLLGMAQQGFSNLLQTSFTAGGGGLRNVWQGITGAFTGIGDAYRGAGGGIGGIGAAISSMLPGIGAISSIVGVVQSVIGTTTKLTNALEGTLGIGGLLRGTEYDIKQRDNIFGSKTEKNAEEIFGSWAKYIAQDLDQEFRDMVQNTRDGIRALGLDINEAFTYDFDVQFDESLPHEQLMERLRQELNNANDELLRTSLAAAGLARDGESGAQTLFILNDSLRTANASLRLLDQSLFDVSAIGAGAARELIEIAGGMDAFANKTAFVFDNFLTTAEQDARALAIANENLAQTFDQLAGISIPETHAQFMALLDAQDLTTAAGRETYAALIDVADEFVTVNGTAQEAAEALGDDLTPALEASTDAARELAAQQREQESLLLQIARMTGNVAYIREQELAALNEANRPLQEYIYLLEDQSDALDTALATARQALTDAEGAFDSAVNTLRALAQNAQDQLDAAEDAARRAFDAQKDLVRANFDAQINDVRTAADAQIEAALATVDALNAEREAAAERAASQAITVREQISLLEGILGSLDSALDNRRALTPEGRAMELAQAQAFLRSSVAAGGVTDPQALEDALAIVADPSTDLFNSFEDYAFDFKVNTGYIQRLRDLTDDALTVEEKTLQALEGQIEAIEAQIEAARTNTEAQIEAIEANATATVEGLEKALAAELGGLDAAFNDLMGIDDSILSVSEATQAVADAQELVAAANSALAVATGDAAVATGALTASLGSVATALEAALAAMQAVDDAQNVVDQVTGGGTGGSGGSGGGSSIPDFGPSSAGKRLLGILEGIDGASGVAALTEQAAFSAFSADRMNAILSDVGVAALSGSAAAAAQAFEDALGRNIDVAGLGFYTGVIDAQTDALGDLDAAMEFVRRDVQANGDQFEYAIQMMAQRLAPPIDATADAAAEAAVRDGAFQTANIGQLVAIQNGIFTLGSQIEGLAAAAVNAAAAAVPAVSAPTGGGASSGVSTASQLVNEALAGAANAAVGSVEESFYLAAAAEWTRRGGIPSYANGTDYHPGGWARLHENEMVNLPRGTSVSTAGETRAMAESNLKIAQQTEQNAAELRQIRRFLQSLADIEEERRAEELAAGA